MTMTLARLAALVAAAVAAAASGLAAPLRPAGERVEHVVRFADYAYFFGDATGERGGESARPVKRAPLAEVLAAPEDAWTPVAAGRPADVPEDWTGFPSKMWARLAVENPGETTRVWRFSSDAEATSFSVVAWAVEPSGAPRLIWRDVWDPNEAAGEAARLPVRRISSSEAFAVRPGETVRVYFDFPGGQSPETSFDLVEADAFLAFVEAEASWNVFLFGMRTALLMGILAFALILRSEAALWYALFTAALYGFFLYGTGYTYAYVTKNAFQDAALGSSFGGLALGFFTQMTRRFLDARRLYPKLDRALIGSLAFGVLCVALSLATQSFIFNAVAFLLPGIFAIAGVNLWAAVHGVRQGRDGAAVFLVAALFLVANCLLGLLAYPPFFAISQAEASRLNHAGLTLDALLFAAALVVQAIGLRRERDAAHAAEVQALTERAEALKRLSDVAAAHENAVALAERRRRELAAASHDMQQPLLSLRAALARGGSEDVVSEGLSYLESVLAKSLDATRPDGAASPAPSAERYDAEGFPLSKAFDSVRTMFEDEAREQGVELRIVPSKARIAGEPVAVMRLLTNLVSNALKHAGATRILVGARRRHGRLDLVVADDGIGMSDDALAAALAPYAKGEGSTGEGLGLALVRELSETLGARFEAASRAGAGSRFAAAGLPAAAARSRGT